MTNGRVLNNEEYDEIAKRVAVSVSISDNEVFWDMFNLIATIQDRDNTVAKLSAKVSTDSEIIDELIQRHNRLVEQNTIMLSTLESMYDHPAHSYYEFTTYAIQTIRDAIAKVKCTPVSEGV